MRKWVNQSAFGKFRGISQWMVARYIRQGKFPADATKMVAKCVLIHMERADAALGESLDLSTKRKFSGNGGETPERKREVTESVDFQRLTYHEAQRQEKRYTAALLKLEYEQKTGVLVRADEVERGAFEMARRVRDGILNIPARISAILAAENDPHIVQQILFRELRQVLEGLSGVQIGLRSFS